MTITYEWSIEQMDCLAKAEQETDVVITVHWRLNAIDGLYVASAYNTQQLPLQQGGAFTPYNQLAKEQVISWVQQALGETKIDELKANLAVQMAELINPPVVTLPLPWAK